MEAAARAPSGRDRQRQEGRRSWLRGKRVPPMLVAWLVVAATVAGCASAPEPGPQEQGSVSVPAGTGIVAGNVASELVAPLSGAEVTLRAPDGTMQRTTTDEGGGFSFPGLEPGRYTLYAGRLGYLSTAKSVEVLPDTITQVTFRLATVPPPAVPYHAVLPFSGLIACSVGLYPAATQDLCAGTDPNAQSVHPFAIGPGLTDMVVLLDWEPKGGFGASLQGLWSAPAGLKPQSFHGGPPLEVRYSLDETVSWQPAGVNATLQVRAYEGEGLGDLQGASLLALQQPYELWVVLFYHGEPVPEGFDPRQEAA